ncbi:MAG: chloride channel protein, partial [Pseudomonadota bacterium]
MAKLSQRPYGNRLVRVLTRAARHTSASFRAQVWFWCIALAVGVAAGTAALFFRKGIEALQAWAYGTDNVNMLHSFAETLPWYWILLIPVLGGLAVGIILHIFTTDGKPHAVAEVIEGAALKDGRVPLKPGIASAVASFITLSTGGSSGREGPVVHIAGLISSWVSDRIRADG